MKKLGWLLGCAMLLAMGIGAQAQFSSNDDISKNWDLRIGFFVPERGSSRAEQGDIWFTFGAERAFMYGERYNGTISVDYYGSGHLYSIPVLVNATSETGRMVYGAGAGIGISHDNDGGLMGFAYSLGVGYKLAEGSNPALLEVRYRGMTTSNGALNGWAITFGKSF